MDIICGPLALRLAKLIGGLHFQVAERTLQLWNSERFTSLVVKSSAHRSTILGTVFPVLHKIQCVSFHTTLLSTRPYPLNLPPPPPAPLPSCPSPTRLEHWHEAIRTASAQVLEQYNDVDAPLFATLLAETESRAADASLAAPMAATSLGDDNSGAETSSHVAQSPAGSASSAAQSVASLSASPTFSPTHRAPAVRGTGLFVVTNPDRLPGHRNGLEGGAAKQRTPRAPIALGSEFSGGDESADS